MDMIPGRTRSIGLKEKSGNISEISISGARHTAKEETMVKGNHPKKDLYMMEREKGLTYQQIADKYGVSKQNVAQLCSKHEPSRFQYNRTCAYPALRKWLNDNKCSTSELVRRMNLVAAPENIARMQRVLCKRNELKKWEIDKLLEITGMTYEELFCQEVTYGQE
jgi:hypothetical protein